MASTVIRKQTAFRLPVELMERLKWQARRDKKSLNAYVEDILTKELEKEWPKLPLDYSATADELFSCKEHIPSPSKEMLKADPKLAYIWNKGA